MPDVLIAIAILAGCVALYVLISYLNDHTERPEGCDRLIEEANCHACNQTDCPSNALFERKDPHASE
jgi:hypothetical protein